MEKRGVTLTELLIAISLLLLVVATDASIRLMGQSYFSQVTNRAIAQSEAALAMASIVRETRSRESVQTDVGNAEVDDGM